MSSSVPGAYATVTLADGRTFPLGSPYDVRDFTMATTGIDYGKRVAIRRWKAEATETCARARSDR